MDSRRALSVASATFGCAAPCIYFVVRLVERALHPPVDPTLVLFDPRVGFYCRSVLAAWAGVVVATAAFFALRAGLPHDDRRAFVALAATTLFTLGAAFTWP